jgi:hypothetical protein
MVNHLNQCSVGNFQLTWSMILWRLLLTALLLLFLAGFGVTIFNNMTTRPDTRVLPTLSTVREQGGGIRQHLLPGP